MRFIIPVMEIRLPADSDDRQQGQISIFIQRTNMALIGHLAKNYQIFILYDSENCEGRHISIINDNIGKNENIVM